MQTQNEETLQARVEPIVGRRCEIICEIEVFQVGCPVLIGETIKATVTAVCIREQLHVTYECTWWDGNTHNCKWLEQIEVARHKASSSVRIGFVAVE